MARIPLLIALTFVTLTSSQAIFFPQTGTTYNNSQNVIDWWAPRNSGYYVGRVESNAGIFTATIIGTNTFITAAHCVGSVPGASFYYHATGNSTATQYAVTSKHRLGAHDLVVCQVQGQFPQNNHNEIRSTAIPADTKMIIFGNGCTPTTPYFHNGVVKAWLLPQQPFGNYALRYGFGRQKFTGTQPSWDFNANDPDTQLQTSVAGTANGDSGGPVFVNGELVGFMVSGSNPSDVAISATDCKTAYWFNVAGLNACMSQIGAYTANGGITYGVIGVRSLIYSLTALRTAATTYDDTTDYNKDWVAWSAGSLKTEPAINIDLSQVSDPAPMAVYQAVRWSYNGSALQHVSTGHIPGRSYTVRVHFSGLPTPAMINYADAYMQVRLNGQLAYGYHNPYGGPQTAVFYKASALTFTGVQPDFQGQITVDVLPEYLRSFVSASAVEITRE